jgi:biopolymer transport protein ExbD
MAMSVGTAAGAVMCDINTTPLIDVMLVLLVTLIVSLPVMTHAVKLDMPNPNAPPPPPDTPPEVIDLEIDFDGTVAWNGTTIPDLATLEGYFHNEAQKDPQPEIHLRPDRRAKYGVVAQVLAAAQHNHMKKIGFTNVAEFGY